ncbi:hypothetical protein N7490_002061 [Penicillium lividum]|nr:hypothetical protein N7490_002061 [Penicillium lividum]
MEEVNILIEKDPNSIPARTALRGYSGNFFTKAAKYQIVSYPHSYQAPGYTFDEKTDFRHKDHFQRVYHGSSDERFLDPVDGRVKELIIQCTDKVYRGPKNSTYKRTFIRNVAPLTLWLANWPMSGLDDDPKQKGYKRFSSDIGLLVKWPISCLLLYPILGVPGIASAGDIVNDGRYDPFPYRYWGYCKVARNAVENRQTLKLSGEAPIASPVEKSLNIQRILEPRALIFDENLPEWHLVEDWKNDPANAQAHGKCPEYVFIAYTAEQFTESIEDQYALNLIAIQAARDAKVPAYWLGAACMDVTDMENEVFRISDIVRGAHSVIIAVGPPKKSLPEKYQSENELKSLLMQWGDRVWTFPEVLLSRNGYLKVYERDKGEATMDLAKNQLPSYMWMDSGNSRYLIDHYANNLQLGPLQLVSIALECLFARENGKYLEGDQSYALMGLLSQRPKIDRHDTAFQAFARLSLANDSNKFLERLICLLPKEPRQEWHCTADGYGVNLWDIEPTCQIAGICDNDTVLIDGAFGATIHWNKFRRVNSRRSNSWKRIMIKLLLHGAPYAFIMGILILKMSRDAAGLLSALSTDLTAIHDTEQDVADDIISVLNKLKSDLSLTGGWITDLINKIGTQVTTSKSLDKVIALLYWMIFFEAIGYLLWILALVAFVASPYLTRLLYRGKFWGSQAWLFGFEGYADLETIESQIFGARMRRLRWSAFGSSLSRHTTDVSSLECVAVDPTTDPEVERKVERCANESSPDGMRIFTLVDTNTMTVTLFEAVRPPSVVLLCASEGGMQRAIACSYQWTTGTCYRETILRMETPVLEKMSRVSRVKVGVLSGGRRGSCQE